MATENAAVFAEVPSECNLPIREVDLHCGYAQQSLSVTYTL